MKQPHAEAGMRIGLLGGSFNPPHDGHRRISIEALRRLGLDWVWWLVTPGNPLKDHSELAALADRVGQCRKVGKHPRIAITGLEAAIGTSYSAETIAHLQEHNPGVNFVWLMGADSLVNFHQWKHWRVIIESVPVAVLDRPGWRLKAKASATARRYRNERIEEAEARLLAGMAAPAWVFLTVPLSPLSSTDLRRKARQSKGK